MYLNLFQHVMSHVKIHNLIYILFMYLKEKYFLKLSVKNNIIHSYYKY